MQIAFKIRSSETSKDIVCFIRNFYFVYLLFLPSKLAGFKFRYFDKELLWNTVYTQNMYLKCTNNFVSLYFGFVLEGYLVGFFFIILVGGGFLFCFVFFNVIFWFPPDWKQKYILWATIDLLVLKVRKWSTVESQLSANFSLLWNIRNHMFLDNWCHL